jgi:hypothetical protein
MLRKSKQPAVQSYYYGKNCPETRLHNTQFSEKKNIFDTDGENTVPSRSSVRCHKVAQPEHELNNAQGHPDQNKEAGGALALRSGYYARLNRIMSDCENHGRGSDCARLSVEFLRRANAAHRVQRANLHLNN